MSSAKSPEPNKSNPSTRTSRGQWCPGMSGNPSGRPVGSRNKATLVEEMLGDRAEDLINKAFELALNKENTTALRLCLERLQPIPKERRIVLALPEVTCIEQAPVAVAAIIKGIATGEITPVEGQTLVAIVETQIRLLQAQQAEQAAKEMAQIHAALRAELDEKLEMVSVGGKTGANRRPAVVPEKSAA